MFFSTRAIAFVATAAMMLAGQAVASPTERAVLIATDPGKLKTFLEWQYVSLTMFSVSACNPPNNGDHTVGSSCKYYSGPSDSSPVIDGSKYNS
jgi:hypothetical protein